MKDKRNRIFILLVMLIVVLLSCTSIYQLQPTSEEQTLRATLEFLQTQVALGQQSTQAPLDQPDNSIPLPTIPNTSPGTVLDVGQSWRQGGWELTLVGVEIYPNGIACFFRLTNLESYDRAIRYSIDNFSAIDNSGRRVPVGYNTCGGCFAFSQNCEPRAIVLSNNNSTNFGTTCDSYGSSQIGLAIDVTDVSVTEVIVEVNISSISQAKWRIPIHH